MGRTLTVNKDLHIGTSTGWVKPGLVVQLVLKKHGILVDYKLNMSNQYDVTTKKKMQMYC